MAEGLVWVTLAAVVVIRSLEGDFGGGGSKRWSQVSLGEVY